MADVRNSSVVIKKVVTENEIKSGRISLPAKVRRRYLGAITGQSYKSNFSLVDENGDTDHISIIVRQNSTKQEIMAKGGKLFIEKRKLSAGDTILFPLSDEISDGQIRFMVEKKKPRLLSPTSLIIFSGGSNIALEDEVKMVEKVEPSYIDLELSLGSLYSYNGHNQSYRSNQVDDDLNLSLKQSQFGAISGVF